MRMKKIQYIIFLALCAGVFITSCHSDPKVTSVGPTTGYGVAFLRASKAITEGSIDTIGILFNADSISRLGATVDFVVVPDAPSSVTAQYKILDMNGSPLTPLQLTNGSSKDGITYFQFVSLDNDVKDGNRSYKISITATSMDYPISEKFGTLALTILDDEAVITREELLGTWSVQEDGDYLPGELPYEVTIAKDDGNSNNIIISGLGLDQDAEVLPPITATLALDSKTKTMTIQPQVITGWRETDPLVGEVILAGFIDESHFGGAMTAIIAPTETGFTMTFKDDAQKYSYLIFFMYDGNGYFMQGRKNTVMTKK
jgi:hypothetical protein